MECGALFDLLNAYAMSPPTSIALVSVCLQGLQPCFPSYAFSPHDACLGYVHVVQRRIIVYRSTTLHGLHI
jgi:hypothetical protein